MKCPELLKDRNGNPSSKRVMGYVAGVIGLLMAIASGLDFYTIEVGLVGTILGFSGGLIGIGVFEQKN